MLGVHVCLLATRSCRAVAFMSARRSEDRHLDRSQGNADDKQDKINDEPFKVVSHSFSSRISL